MNELRRCYICREEIESFAPGCYSSITLEDGLIAFVCKECDHELNGKVAIIAETKNKIRTGDVIFLSRRTVKNISNLFADDHHVFVVEPEGLKDLIQRIILSR